MADEIGFEVHVQVPYEQALEMVKQGLKTEGFGVLTAIDVKAIMKEKLGEDFRPYTILGACNPPLAHRALSEDPVVGLVLPCNVTVEADEEGTGSIIRFVNPEMMLTIGTFEGNPVLSEVATQARERLERVAESLLPV